MVDQEQAKEFFEILFQEKDVTPYGRANRLAYLESPSLPGANASPAGLPR